MRIDLEPLQNEIVTVLPAHGVELVAIEWLQGPGRGVLRVYIDRPGGDPRGAPDPTRGMSADVCAQVSRDVGALLDALDLIAGAYDLEVSTPGFERPVQKREDFARFAGLEINVKTRVAVGGRQSFTGPLRGVKDLADGAWAVLVETRAGTVEVPREVITRARLSEIKAPPRPKPGKGPRRPHEKDTTPAGTSPAGHKDKGPQEGT